MGWFESEMDVETPKRLRGEIPNGQVFRKSRQYFYAKWTLGSKYALNAVLPNENSTFGLRDSD